jgi:probable HAF family extracellular repeat protein
MIESLLSQVMRLTADGTAAFGVNASGHIVGSSYGKGGIQGFLYRGGTYTTLDVVGIETVAHGINASDHIVGSYREKDPSKRRGFFYVNGLYATIDHPSAYYETAVLGINAAGHIVGDYYPASTKMAVSAGSRGLAPIHGFLYINGLYATIDYPSAPETTAMAINDDGQIVGIYAADERGVHGFLLSGGTYAAIDYPLATNTYATGINNDGLIVGTYADSTHYNHGFLYNPNGGTYTTIDYPLAEYTNAWGINDHGQIVGSYNKASRSHGFLYNPNGGTYTTLDAP